MQNSIEMIGFCFFLFLLLWTSIHHTLIFILIGIKDFYKLFEEKLAEKSFFCNFANYFMI